MSTGTATTRPSRSPTMCSSAPMPPTFAAELRCRICARQRQHSPQTPPSLVFADVPASCCSLPECSYSDGAVRPTQTPGARRCLPLTIRLIMSLRLTHERLSDPRESADPIRGKDGRHEFVTAQNGFDLACHRDGGCRRSV